MKNKTLYICKRADICPITKTPCSPECKLTSKDWMAKYNRHLRFERDERGNYIEQEPD